MPQEEDEEDVLDILHTQGYISASNEGTIYNNKTQCCLFI